VAGCISRTAVAPLERLKILYQVQDVMQKGHSTSPQYTSMTQSIRKIVAEESWRGLFKGNGANCVRVFPYAAIQFAMYVSIIPILSRNTIFISLFECRFEKMQPILMEEGQTALSPLRKLFSGAIAGVVSVIVTYPLDFIRARITVQGSMTSQHYTGIWGM